MNMCRTLTFHNCDMSKNLFVLKECEIISMETAVAISLCFYAFFP